MLTFHILFCLNCEDVFVCLRSMKYVYQLYLSFCFICLLNLAMFIENYLSLSLSLSLSRDYINSLHDVGLEHGDALNLLSLPSGILVTALVGTSVAFGSFSAAAMLARRREYL